MSTHDACPEDEHIAEGKCPCGAVHEEEDRKLRPDEFVNGPRHGFQWGPL